MSSNWDDLEEIMEREVFGETEERLDMEARAAEQFDLNEDDVATNLWVRQLLDNETPPKVLPVLAGLDLSTGSSDSSMNMFSVRPEVSTPRVSHEEVIPFATDDSVGRDIPDFRLFSNIDANKKYTIL